MNRTSQTSELAPEQSSAADVGDFAALPSARRAATGLFLISVLILFLELACIRWFPAHVLFLTFFTNTVLLACFLGMSVGCLAAGHPRNYIFFTAPILAVSMLAAGGVEALRSQLEQMLDVGHQTAPQLVFFGTEYHVGDAAHFVVPIELLEGLFFFLIALAMVGPGQELGRAMNRIANRVQAYTVNILGSIVGIVLFFLCSWLQLSPAWWFLLVALGLAYFVVRFTFRVRQIIQVLLLVGIVWIAHSPLLAWGPEGNEEYWSPYYRIDYHPADRLIVTNLISHQYMRSCLGSLWSYAMPYFLNRDTGGENFEDVLIIGAGSGNDVSRALQWGAEHIDAVEIDPVIWRLGKRFHPNLPYSDTDRVTVHLNDGRNFLRTTDKKYDLIVYALVDSLVLHSSYSNIRLESYLFTKEAIADVKRNLKPGGLFVMYNYFRQGWIVARLKKTLNEVFQTEPLVLTLPYQAVVNADERSYGFTCLIAGDAQALERVRKAFHWSEQGDNSQTKPYFLNTGRVAGPNMPNGFLLPPPSVMEKEWDAIAPARVVEPPDLRVATDDWPFLYLRRPMIPDLSLRGAAVMAGVALLLLLWFVPPRQSIGSSGRFGETRGVLRFWTTRRWVRSGSRLFDGRMFFLGAGFMLIETKAVVHLALLFGSTWVVNSVVFFAVLVMILLANLFVLARRPQKLWPFYVGLFIALVMNIVIPLNSFLGLLAWLRIASSCLLVFAPILFAAVIFAISFGRTAEAHRAFGFNIAGAVLGGLAEYSSMLLGFQYLLLVAIAFYVLSAMFLDRANGRGAVVAADALA